MLMGDLLKQRGNALVRLDRGFGQMPGQALRIVSSSPGQHLVRLPTLGAGRAFDDRRSDQRMVERKPACGVVDVRHTCPLRRGERLEAAPVRTEHDKISRPVEYGKEQDIASRGGQMIDSTGEQPF